MTTITTPDIRRSASLGTDLSQASTIDEALTIAGLDWGLNMVPAENLSVLTDDGVISTSIPGHRLVMRDDSHLTLGVVGRGYETLDNHEVFSLGERFLANGARLAKGGALDGGRRVFMDFDLPETHVQIGKGDLVKFSLSIRANHDGKGNVIAGLVAERLVCSNGMTAKIPSLPHTFTVRHTKNADLRMREADTILAGAAEYAKGFAAIAQEMVDTPFTATEFAAYIDQVYPKPTESGRALTTWENRRRELMHLFRSAPTNELGRGTAWAAYNSLTEWIDWASPVRSTGGATEEQTRARRQFDATKQDVKDHGFALLTA